jgi:hypothetical protein
MWAGAIAWIGVSSRSACSNRLANVEWTFARMALAVT